MTFVKRFNHVHVVTNDEPYKRKISIPVGDCKTTVLQTWIKPGPLNPASPGATNYALFDFRKDKTWDGEEFGNVIGFGNLDFAAAKNLSNGSGIGKPREEGGLNTKRWADNWPEGDLRLLTYTYQAGGDWTLEIDGRLWYGRNPDDKTDHLDVSEDWHVIFGVDGGERDSVQLGWEFGPWSLWALEADETAGAPPAKPGETTGPTDPPVGPPVEPPPEGSLTVETAELSGDSRVHLWSLNGEQVSVYDPGSAQPFQVFSK